MPPKGKSNEPFEVKYGIITIYTITFLVYVKVFGGEQGPASVIAPQMGKLRIVNNIIKTLNSFLRTQEMYKLISKNLVRIGRELELLSKSRLLV